MDIKVPKYRKHSASGQAVVTLRVYPEIGIAVKPEICES